MSALKRISLFKISLLVLFASFVIAGIMRDEIIDVINNATLICFSCIGLK